MELLCYPLFAVDPEVLAYELKLIALGPVFDINYSSCWITNLLMTAYQYLKATAVMTTFIYKGLSLCLLNSDEF